MKSKTTTIILCLLFGGLGIHQFYINRAGKGLIYLLFSWTFIPAIIAIYDLVVFATIDKADFDRLYNQK